LTGNKETMISITLGLLFTIFYAHYEDSLKKTAINCRIFL